jgi:hypothetical protein
MLDYENKEMEYETIQVEETQLERMSLSDSIFCRHLAWL